MCSNLSWSGREQHTQRGDAETDLDDKGSAVERSVESAAGVRT